MSPNPIRTGSSPASSRPRTRLGLAAIAALVLSACAGGPDPAAERASRSGAGFSLTTFSATPGWEQIDARPAFSAFQRSCERIFGRSGAAPMMEGLWYAGRAMDWQAPCMFALTARPETPREAREFFQAWFVPVEVTTPGRLTGYYEPFVEVRRSPDPEFSMAIRALPGAAPASEASDLGGLIARLEPGAGAQAGPLPPRAQIEARNLGAPLAWGRPIDVFFLQIQGSGRLVFADGSQARAAFAGHNDQPYVSIGRLLVERGALSPHDASKQDIEAWLRANGPSAWRPLFDENPRYVFFQLEPIADPQEGPRGAQGAPLTPMASLAVDPAHHPWGAPILIEADLPGAPAWRGLVVAQDAGGAIKGRARGDLFFGWGPEAGAVAGRQNDPDARWTMLLPAPVAAALAASS